MPTQDRGGDTAITSAAFSNASYLRRFTAAVIAAEIRDEKVPPVRLSV
jgi:hypothetical protein